MPPVLGERDEVFSMTDFKKLSEKEKRKLLYDDLPENDKIWFVAVCASLILILAFSVF